MYLQVWFFFAVKIRSALVRQPTRRVLRSLHHSIQLYITYLVLVLYLRAELTMSGSRISNSNENGISNCSESYANFLYNQQSGKREEFWVNEDGKETWKLISCHWLRPYTYNFRREIMKVSSYEIKIYRALCKMIYLKEKLWMKDKFCWLLNEKRYSCIFLYLRGKEAENWRNQVT